MKPLSITGITRWAKRTLCTILETSLSVGIILGSLVSLMAAKSWLWAIMTPIVAFYIWLILSDYLDAFTGDDVY